MIPLNNVKHFLINLVGSNSIVGINICIIILKKTKYMWMLIIKTEYFIYIVAILRIVRSESQTSIHI